MAHIKTEPACNNELYQNILAAINSPQHAVLHIWIKCPIEMHHLESCPERHMKKIIIQISSLSAQTHSFLVCNVFFHKTGLYKEASDQSVYWGEEKMEFWEFEPFWEGLNIMASSLHQSSIKISRFWLQDIGVRPHGALQIVAYGNGKTCQSCRF